MARRPAVTPETRDTVLARDDYRCVICGKPNTGPRGGSWSIHHRKLRSQGGAHTPDNLIVLCGGSAGAGCHQAVHASPAHAVAHGWIVPSWANPARELVLAHAGRAWVRLLPDGSTELKENSDVA